jgi:hypothetical protein
MNVMWKPLVAAILLAAVLVAAVPQAVADASTFVDDRIAAGQVASQEAAKNGDDRVEVQLVVLGVVLVTVFGLGTGAYLLRWKLGRTAYAPPTDTGHH